MKFEIDLNDLPLAAKRWIMGVTVTGLMCLVFLAIIGVPFIAKALAIVMISLIFGFFVWMIGVVTVDCMGWDN